MKSFLLVAISMAILQHGYSQDIVNGDFSINCGGSTVPAASCTTFSTGCIYNWERSHGAPKLAISIGSASVSIWGAHSFKGQGIMGGYLFCPGQTYTIYIHCINGTTLDPTSVLKVAASTGITTPPSACYEPTPAPSVLNTVQTLNATQINNAITTGIPAVVSFTCTTAADKLWIFAEAEDGFFVDIDHVTVVKSCSDITIVGSPYPGAIIQGYGNIFAGWSPTPVTVTGRTVFDAGSSIELKDNFLADPASYETFIAKITTCEKTSCTMDGIGGVGMVNTNGQSGTDKNITAHNFINPSNAPDWSTHLHSSLTANPIVMIYPNPNNGNFTIEMPATESFNFELENSLGVTVYKTEINQEKKIQIILNDQLPVGTYAFHLTGNNINYVGKVIIK